MRYSFSILFVFILMFSSCKSDNAANGDSTSTSGTEINLDDVDLDANQDVELDVKMDEAIAEDQLAKKLIVESKKTTIAEEAKVEDRNETKLEGKSQEQKIKEAEMKKQATKKMIESSVNKGKSCDEILAEQKKFIDDFEASKDRKIILKMAKSKNDPFFKECSKNEAFAKTMEELTVRLETIMDQE